MPIAVIYMRPEHVLTEMPTFWDYGAISEYSPTTEPCVLGDSDDFLMAELRSEGTFRELLHLGWPTAAEIAADLSSFTTQDHHDYGRHTLVLHSGDLPSDLDTPRRELANFVDSVYERLTPPISHRDHPFWKPQFPLFLARHQEKQQGRQAREAIKQRLLREDPHEALRQQIIDELRTEARTIEREIRLTEIRLAGENRSFAEGLSRVEETYRSRRAALESEFEPVRDKYENELRGLRKELAALDAKRADFERNQNSRIDRRCLDQVMNRRTRRTHWARSTKTLKRYRARCQGRGGPSSSGSIIEPLGDCRRPRTGARTTRCCGRCWLPSEPPRRRPKCW
jgi:hypothetical protein